jgi:PIN domain nuclease of toxin-antitoxin system
MLDTCAFVWLVSEPARLSAKAKLAIDDADDLFLSDVSVWELCLKWHAKKLTLPLPPRAWVSEQVKLWSLQSVGIEREHLYRSSELPELHKDPFDRLLVAQTLALGAQLVTPDSAVRQYPVACLW